MADAAVEDNDPTSAAPLRWSATTLWNANGNTSLREDDTLVVFNASTSHRSVFGAEPMRSGVHEFQVTVRATPCCGYLGLAEEGRLAGAQNAFFDADTCLGFSNFSPPRDVGREVGAWGRIRVDFEANTITYVTRHGERIVHKSLSGRTLYAALDSDEHGMYAIERCVRATERSAVELLRRPVEVR